MIHDAPVASARSRRLSCDCGGTVCHGDDVHVLFSLSSFLPIIFSSLCFHGLPPRPPLTLQLRHKQETYQPLFKCMSFNPAPKQANAAANKTNALASTNDASAAADATADDAIFKMRTFDVFWVDKSALMYRDGFAKVRSFYEGSYGA